MTKRATPTDRVAQLICFGLVAIGIAGYSLDEHAGAATLHQKVNLAIAALGFAFLRIDVAPVREKWAVVRDILPWFRRAPEPSVPPPPFNFVGDDKEPEKPVNDP